MISKKQWWRYTKDRLHLYNKILVYDHGATYRTFFLSEKVANWIEEMHYLYGED